jgi:hypothetical protein
MKCTDYNVVLAVAIKKLEQGDCLILDYLTIEEAAQCMTMIYLCSDLMDAITMDYTGNISVIASPYRIAVLYLKHQSFYKGDTPICQYVDLADDINEIVLRLDAALERWEEQNA